MKIKKGDTVIIIKGKDKGKNGKIVKAFPKLGSVIVSGLNLKKRHQKSRKSGQKGQIVEKSMPMSVSNVMVLDSKSGKGVRVGKKLISGKYVRINRKTEQEI